MFSETGILATLYAVILSILAGRLFFSWRNQRRYRAFLSFLGIFLSFILTLPSLLLFEVSGDQSQFLGVPLSEVITGSWLVFLFAIAWLVGFEICGLTAKSSKTSFQRIRPLNGLLIACLIALPSIAYIFRYIEGFDYGASQKLYAAGRTEAGVYGLVGGMASLFIPICAATLYSFLNTQRNTWLHNSKKSSWLLIAFGYAILGLDLLLGFTQDMQRGDLVATILMIVILMLGFVSRLSIVLLSSFMFSFLMLASPILDYMRNPNLGAKDAASIVDAIEHAEKKTGIGISSQRILLEPARKAALGASTASLVDAASEKNVYFWPYLNSVAAAVPRYFWPSKPVAESSDGTMAGRATNVAASNAGLHNVWWVSGAGTMYWELGLPGVVIGGGLVGIFWSYTARKALLENRFIWLVFFFWTTKWGLPLISGTSYLFNVVLEFYKLTLPGFLLFLGARILCSNYAKGPSTPLEQALIGEKRVKKDMVSG